MGNLLQSRTNQDGFGGEGVLGAVGADKIKVGVGVDVGIKVGIDVGAKVGVGVDVGFGVYVGKGVGELVGVRVGLGHTTPVPLAESRLW